MGHRVRVITGKGPVSLPNKTVLKDGEETVLTDAQFATLSAAVGTLLTDVGVEAAPGENTGGTGDVTSAQLTSAVTTLQTALGLKQDASTAATDAEVATVQSALATLISANTTSIAAKQDAATAATDAELASALLKTATVWTANTAYVTGQWVITPGGYLASAKTNFTSGGTYSSSNWNEITPPGTRLGYAKNETGTVQSITSNAGTDVAGCSLLISATSRPVVVRGKFIAKVTTGVAAGVAGKIQAHITDAANTFLDISSASIDNTTGTAELWTVYTEYHADSLAVDTTFKLRASMDTTAFAYQIYNGLNSPSLRSYIVAFAG